MLSALTEATEDTHAIVRVVGVRTRIVVDQVAFEHVIDEDRESLRAVPIGCGLRRGELLALRLESLQQREERWVIADLVGRADTSDDGAVPWVQSESRERPPFATTHQSSEFTAPFALRSKPLATSDSESRDPTRPV